MPPPGPPPRKPLWKGGFIFYILIIFLFRNIIVNDISRIFYFFYVGNKIVVTNGFIKKTQKTPQTEFEKAQKYKQDYERRHLHE